MNLLSFLAIAISKPDAICEDYTPNLPQIWGNDATGASIFNHLCMDSAKSNIMAVGQTSVAGTTDALAVVFDATDLLYPKKAWSVKNSGAIVSSNFNSMLSDCAGKSNNA